MNENIYDLLRKKGYLKGSKINEKIISKLTSNKIIDLSAEISELTINKKISRANSAFTSSAAISISGGKFPCIGTECRYSRVKQLAQYAALYSDRIFIKNYLTDYITTQHIEHGEDIMVFNFINDLGALAMLEPLTKEGRIVIYSTPINKCPHCLAEESFGKDASVKIEHERKKLMQKYNDNVTGFMYKDGDSFKVDVFGPPELIEHGASTITMVKGGKAPFSKNAAYMKRLLAGEKVAISRAQMKKYKILDIFTHHAMNDIAFDLSISQIYGTSFLTDRSVQIDMLNSISKSNSIKKRNQIAEKYLTTMVPFLDNIAIEDLVKLRKKEGNAFILFRQALSKAIDEYKKGDHDFTEKEARDIYSDIIVPSLSKLDSKIAAAKRNLIKSARREATGWVGAISFGMYAGLIQTELAVTAASLGLVKVAADIINRTMQNSDVAESIRSEEMYFLWKVSKLSRI